MWHVRIKSHCLYWLFLYSKCCDCSCPFTTSLNKNPFFTSPSPRNVSRWAVVGVWIFQNPGDEATLPIGKKCLYALPNLHADHPSYTHMHWVLPAIWASCIHTLQNPTGYYHHPSHFLLLSPHLSTPITFAMESPAQPRTEPWRRGSHGVKRKDHSPPTHLFLLLDFSSRFTTRGKKWKVFSVFAGESA